MKELLFENAHCHSIISNIMGFPDSPASILDYAKVYKERNMQCLCLSLHGHRSDVWQQADMAAKYSDDTFKMKPICAAEVYFVPDRNPELKDDRNFHLLLLAKNNDGFKELNYILSVAQETGFYKHARIDFDLLGNLNYNNFLCTTACIGGIFKDPNGEKYANTLHEIFKLNFRLLVQHHVVDAQIKHNLKIILLYKKYKWPLFFATDSHYINELDEILRKLLQASRKIFLPDSEWKLFLPTAQQAYNNLIQQNVLTKAQIEEAFENTLLLREFDGFSYTTERKLPISILRQGMSKLERKKLYQRLVCKGYIEKEGMPSDAEKKALRELMNVILNTDSEDYFISLKDMLDRGVLLGGVLTKTARGSAGSFATNYALGFTTINRLKAPVQMYPERFISEDKLKAGNPDIDSNLTNVEAFEQAGKEMFGEYGCLPMVAFGKTKTSSAFKLLARARDLDFQIANDISKQLNIYEKALTFAISEHEDDPFYNAEDDVDIKDYISELYLPLIELSKKYKNIIVNISPHPCAHLTYHSDLRKDIGTIKVKDKICLYIDGATADMLNYVKSDLLRVDVVKSISECFKEIHQPVISVKLLLEIIDDNPRIWDLYANGYTQALNQCEKASSTKKIMQFKPKNITELAYFVAAIRPGFKSNIQSFISRTPFTYGIKSLDALLRLLGTTGNTADSSYLIYDLNILRCLKFAGIPGPEAYATIKAIKKKKKDKVLKVKLKFRQGFSKYLMLNEGATEQLANDTVEKAWKVIEDSASYLFCGAHAYAMACDSAYGAYLKAYYPYEFYLTQLKLYTLKKNRLKIALLVSLMKRYANINMSAGEFGKDNRDWLIDKLEHTISQSLSSIKFISTKTANILFELGNKKYNNFTLLLYDMIINNRIDVRSINILIILNYFRRFGSNGKLMNIFNEFNEGKNKITKTLVLKTVQKRMLLLKLFEQNCTLSFILPLIQLQNEQLYIGMCISKFSNVTKPLAYVMEVDTNYGVKAKLYSIRFGNTLLIKIKKDTFNSNPFETGQCLYIIKQPEDRQRCIFKDGKRTPILGEYLKWLEKYEVKDRSA